MLYTRRDMGKLALSALPVTHLLASPSRVVADDAVAKPHSNFGGVNVGIIAPYAFRGTANNVDDILKGMIQLGLSSVEMQSDPVEAYAGAPARRRGPRGPRGRGPGAGRPQGGGGRAGQDGERRGGGGNQRQGPEGQRPRGGRGRRQLTPEQQAARRAAAEEMRKWRLSQSMGKFEEIRKKYEDTGVSIDIVKFGLGPNMTDDEVDYCFQRRLLGRLHRSHLAGTCDISFG